MDIDGTSGPDSLVGTPGPDVIRGFGGNDSLDGGAGADRLEGGDGDDVFYVDHAGDVIIELLNGGVDIVYASVGYTLTAGAHVELLTTTSIASTNAIDMTGNELDNTIWGNNGANTLSGGIGGNDTLVGFLGNDIYLINNTNEVIVENAGEGTDIVYVNSSYTLSAHASIELLSTFSIAGTQNYNLTGNNLDNTIWGNNGNNQLSGGFGGNDTLVGFLGDDVYIVNNITEVIVENAGEGTDIVYVNSSYTLSAHASIELLSTFSIAGTQNYNMTGNNLDNTIWGNRGNNTLSGGIGGNDTLVGFLGDDIYLVNNGNEVISELVNEGTDIVYASVNYILSAGASIELLSTNSIGGTDALNLTGNELAQTIWGNGGANVLNGGLGNDTLNGFGGADTFAFTSALGAGNIDIVSDFSVVDDTISLGGAAGQPFAILATGSLRVGTLVIGAAALDADDYLIYNSGTGALLFDADGNGAGAAVQFATLGTGLALTVADFVVTGNVNNVPSVTSGGNASIAENTPASTIVYQATATDADGDRLTWSLTGADAGLLTIDANGAVRLISPADFETKTSYAFNVIASDSGAASTQRAVTLSITNVNDTISTPLISETASNNNTRPFAQSIDPGTFLVTTNPNLHNDDYPSATIVGNISPANPNGSSDDVDFYSITLTAGQQIILDIDGTSGGLDAFLSFFGPSGTLIGENDDLGSFDPGSVPTIAPHNTDSQIIFRVSTSGTYYFSVESFEGGSSGGYQLHVSINSVPATPQQIMAEDIDAIISGAAWTDLSLTFGFPSSPTHYPSDFDEVKDPDGPSGPLTAPVFDAFTAAQQSATRSLLTLIANVSPLTFTENAAQGPFSTAGTAANADLRFAESSEAAPAAYAYYPTNGGPGSEGGSAWFDPTDNDFGNPVKGNYAWMGILHEIGHALGLKHGHEFPAPVSQDHDSLEYTVMTYRSYPGDSVSGGYGNETWGFAQTLMMLDIAALQKIYDGANYGFNAGDTIYTWSPTTGEMSINGAGQGAPGNGVLGSNRIFMTIWDGGGADTYDFSNYTSLTNATTIDLRPGEWVDLDVQLANLGGGNFARGNVANALMFKDNVNSLIENAIGTSVGDFIVANQVANRLTGGGGDDRFIWYSASHTAVGAADRILDFSGAVQADRLDLSRIDAIAGTPADNPFTFIGTDAFHNVAGELRYQVISGNSHIFGDTDGNGTADIEIILQNVLTVAATDFFF